MTAADLIECTDLKVARSINGKYVEISHHHHKARSGNNDSDSGNDSGIVAHEKKLLSPYATVTKPRTPSHSSSGHGRYVHSVCCKGQSVSRRITPRLNTNFTLTPVIIPCQVFGVVVFISLEPASGRVTYFILRALHKSQRRERFGKKCR